MPRIFVLDPTIVDDPRVAKTGVSQLGEVVALFDRPRAFNPFDEQGAAARAIVRALDAKGFNNDSDLVLLSVPFLPTILLMWVLGVRYGVCRVLMFDAKNDCYRERTLDSAYVDQD